MKLSPEQHLTLSNFMDLLIDYDINDVFIELDIMLQEEQFVLNNLLSENVNSQKDNDLNKIIKIRRKLSGVF